MHTPTEYQLACERYHDDFMARRRDENNRVHFARLKAWADVLDPLIQAPTHGLTADQWIAGEADCYIQALIDTPPDTGLLSVPITPIRGEYWQWITNFVEGL